MNEALELEVGQRILEVGAGSGWHASTVAEVVAPTGVKKENWGHIYAVEVVAELVTFARKNIENAGYGDRVTIIHGDGSEGYAKMAPYDRILVTAAAPDVPKPLIEELKDKGAIVIPVGEVGFYQTLFRLRRIDGKIVKEDLGGVAFVPLVGKHGFRG